MLYSLAFGLVAAGCYALISLRSPAPPVVALVGLLGMLGGEFVTGHIVQSTNSIAQEEMNK